MADDKHLCSCGRPRSHCMFGKADVNIKRYTNSYGAKVESKFPAPSGRYLRFDLIPFEALDEVIEVFTFGQEKHVDKKQGEGQSWRAGQLYSVRVNKAIRHLTSFVRGQKNDGESGRHHLAHAIVQLMMLLGMECHPKRYAEFDNRGDLRGEEYTESNPDEVKNG